MHLCPYNPRMLFFGAKEWRPCWGVLSGHLDEDDGSTANPLWSPWAALDALRWTLTGPSLATALLPLSADHRQFWHYVLFSTNPAAAYFPEKLHVTTKPCLWRKIFFSFLVVFLDCVQPGLLKDVADFIWSIDESTLKFLSWHQVRQNPLKKILDNQFTWVRM